MKKLYLKQSKGIPLSSYTPDIGLLKSADLNVDIIIHSNDHYTGLIEDKKQRKLN